MNQGLIEAKMTDLKNYFKSHGDISTVYLFGSYGTLLYDPERSDIDLAIIFNRELTLKEEMLVDAEISVILESDNLDVVNLNKARVDICNHIISRKCLGMPKTKADSFIILCQNNILSPDMQETCSAMARFRNRVVHLYDEVDTADVYQYVNEGISDFNRFVDDINKFLTRKQN